MKMGKMFSPIFSRCERDVEQCVKQSLKVDYFLAKTLLNN